MPSIFISYAFADEVFAEMLARHIRTQRPALDCFFYNNDRRAGDWETQLGMAIKACHCMVSILGKQPGNTQIKEMELAAQWNAMTLIPVQLPGGVPSPIGNWPANLTPINVVGDQPPELQALIAAKQIAELLKIPNFVWHEVDDVPPGYPFEYEKDIISVFKKTKQLRGREATANGNGGEATARWKAKRAHIPISWPKVPKWSDEAGRANPVSPATIGSFGDDTCRVLVDARVGVGDESLTLPEARPRSHVVHPRDPAAGLGVGIVVAGGVAPGINAVIHGIFERHRLYADPPADERNPCADYQRYHVSVHGYLEGFRSVIRGKEYPRQVWAMSLTREFVDEHAHEGGSVIGTSRCDELMQSDPRARMTVLTQMVQNLTADGINILYVIGGDGSMRAAHAISIVARQMGAALTVVGIPKTMDNDVLWVWQSFGFMSAVEKAREVIRDLQTEIRSNPRLCIVQLFGSDSGFVVAHAVLGSGQCDIALVPEVGFTMKGLCQQVKKKLHDRRIAVADNLGIAARQASNPYGMIVMAETAIPRDAMDYIDDPDIGLSEKEKDALRLFVADLRVPDQPPLPRRVRGQTPDPLRTAGLKIVSRALERYIQREMGGRDVQNPPHGVNPYWKDFRVVTNEPRHLLRSIRPSVSDVIFGQRLGALAVDNALAGYTDFMVSQWLTEYVLVPLKLVVLGRKRLPHDGIFWKSVLASTAQADENLVPIDSDDCD